MAQLERRRSAQERYGTFRLNAVSRLDLQFCGWGRNDYGQLGIETDTHQPTPVALEAFSSKDIVHIAGNASFNTAALTDDGEVYVMGSNDVGQLGMKSTQALRQPTRVNALESFRITHVAVGFSHMLAITEQVHLPESLNMKEGAVQGALLAWGSNEQGQLGCDTPGSFTATPKRVKHDTALHFVRVAAGAAHSLALTSNGGVYSCGQGSYGALGHGNTSSLSVFSRIVSLIGYGIVQVECGEYHSAALSVDGRVWTWGRGKYGQLGHGDRQNRLRPTPVTSLRDHRMKHVACGDAHTLCCGSYGAVFSWGYSKWGQTGTGSTEDVLAPLLIEQLREEYIIQVSCGSRHSLALAQRGVIFAFGNGELGQLGNSASTEICANPIPVPDLPPHPIICILASLSQFQQQLKTALSTLPLSFGRYGQGVMPFKVMDLYVLLDSVEKSRDASSRVMLDTFLSAIEDIFSSPGFLLHTFGSADSTEGSHGLRIASISSSYERIFRSYDEKTITHVGTACTTCLRDMLVFLIQREATGESGTALEERLRQWMRVLIVIMLNPVFGEDLASGGDMVHSIASMIESLTPTSLELLEAFVVELPVEVFGGRLINGVQKHLNSLSKNSNSIHNPLRDGQRSAVLKVCELLNMFYQANLRRSEAVSFHRFYNQSVSDGFEMGQEYLVWTHSLSHPDRSPGYKSICQVPFILTPEAKSNITQGEAMIVKSFAVRESTIGALFSGIHPGNVSYLDIHIRRDHIREDAMNQLVHRGRDLQKPLRVKFFSNGVEEEGEDEGGLSKEFFQLLVEEIFNVDFGMFVYNEGTRDFWFSQQALEIEDFRLVGIVLGLAIYNTVILDVHFPLVVYKKLKGLKTSLADLKEAFPELGRGLQQLLDFEGDVENTFFRTFEVEYEYFGEMMTAELKPGGASIAVTEHNRQEYVDLYSKYILEDSIQEQFNVFKKGFLEVFSGHSLKLYRYEELELLICGLPHLDFHELERVARYDGGYTTEHPTIRNFWSVIHGLSLADKKQFLAFVTGCDRAPVGGLSTLNLLIQRSGPDTQRLPTSHTCFNILLLPDYRSRAKLEDRLMVAIKNAQGFGLQ